MQPLARCGAVDNEGVLVICSVLLSEDNWEKREKRDISIATAMPFYTVACGTQ